jgi:phosphopantothenoylcysteine decarboxylase/phosphopantothenate--cysteine ligase
LGSSNAVAGRRVLLGVTGGIAAYKACLLARLLIHRGADVQAVLTKAATRFVGPDTFSALTGRRARVDPWEQPGTVLHVRLAHEADVAVVAPATANLLAKLAAGVADDLLSSTLLEARCPLVLAPAMHTGMWEHPATRANLDTLRARGAVVVPPGVGPLAAGDEGVGRLAEPEDVLAAVERTIVARPGDLSGRRIVVTAGPTWEPIDPVRFVGNRSSGRMGFAVAAEAFRRGADVILVVGPGTLDPPAGPRSVRVSTAEEMRVAVVDAAADADAVVMAAAVADFRPEHVEATKVKKDAGPPEIKLVPTADILAGLGADGGRQVLVGFAAETSGDLIGAARDKLEAKHLDAVVVNRVGGEGIGFGSETSEAAIVTANARDPALQTWTKPELASSICDLLAASFTRRKPRP